MNFELTKTEQLFRQMIREFAENEVKPLAAEIDEEERFPVETVEKMAKLGIFGIPFPVNYGGAGGNYGQILSKDREWTVSDRQMEVTNNAFFMHCLPVRRNMIVTDDVIESPQSIVIPEAANREISATVVLKKLLESL